MISPIVGSKFETVTSTDVSTSTSIAGTMQVIKLSSVSDQSHSHLSFKYSPVILEGFPPNFTAILPLSVKFLPLIQTSVSSVQSPFLGLISNNFGVPRKLLWNFYINYTLFPSFYSKLHWMDAIEPFLHKLFHLKDIWLGIEVYQEITSKLWVNFTWIF